MNEKKRKSTVQKLRKKVQIGLELADMIIAMIEDMAADEFSITCENKKQLVKLS